MGMEGIEARWTARGEDDRWSCPVATRCVVRSGGCDAYLDFSPRSIRRTRNEDEVLLPSRGRRNQNSSALAISDSLFPLYNSHIQHGIEFSLIPTSPLLKD